VYKRKIRITKLDVVVATLILLLAAYIAYRLTMKLNYRWNWSIIPQYLFFFGLLLPANRSQQLFACFWR
jgi:polar amino acid transport system permease protein